MCKNKLGLDGLDPVAFMGHFQRTLGKPAFRSKHRGQTYFFSNSTNQELFERNPDIFLPQLDGYCALTYAVSGSMVPASANHCKTINDKLYLFSNPVYAKICQMFPSLLEWAHQRYGRINVQLANA